MWIGVQVTTDNKKQALNIGIQYISDQTRPAETPIARILEGQETKVVFTHNLMFGFTDGIFSGVIGHFF